ncbi:hypothetical protein TVAG_092180 [Trichomonas vaginalis G3]|uniref:C2H2-type domain-containing protein n=1 Tax=Trichomonas vaginalis (strain ATCC PRA-98 / G3) TaxID=412133 RepID=A2FWH5_TRIV3|nr:zinc finger, C2H2-type family protein [Trichomonas vaginalis G3]EAX90745.1 hypothetical protein TVAG_092180 [Trichomonas vaginalis G3]KAI5515764.1 zinc finger, C2H2-type family protein [Trichomonas vaginalis G3]|eukprot:XP_001303675.1 hypothetical protein [Trichomonas vaginalis G3]
MQNLYLRADSKNQYNVHTLHEGIDWGLVQKTDPAMLRETQDYDSMQEFINSFTFANLNDNDRRMFGNPLCSQLIENLQTTVKYMFDCQDYLLDEIHRLKQTNRAMKKKIKLLYDSKERDQALLRDAYHEYEKCPVCGKKFQALKYVDQHIQKVHPSHIDAWTSLRVDHPLPQKAEAEKLKKEIDMLKTTLFEQTRAFTATMEKFRLHAQAIHKHDEEKAKTQVPKLDFYEYNPKMQTQPQPFETVKSRIPLTQNVLTVEFDSSLLTSSDEGVLDIDEEIRKINKSVSKKVNEIRLGHPVNYITPRQTAQILDYQNEKYQRIKRAARKQLHNDFPLQTKEKSKSQEKSKSLKSSLTTETEKDQEKPLDQSRPIKQQASLSSLSNSTLASYSNMKAKESQSKKSISNSSLSTHEDDSISDQFLVDA